MKTLAERLAEIAQKSLDWIAEDPENRGAGIITQDLDHWKEYDIHTASQLDHYLLVSDVFEMTRDLYHYKRDWSKLNAMTDAELSQEIDDMHEGYKQDLAIEESYKKEQIRVANETAHKKRCAMTRRTDFTPMGLLFP